MADPELGTKQVCPTCEAKFYDLNKRPAVCPKCQYSFDPDDESAQATKTK
ncbi:MAG: TIGR02300 family protein, partial [Pseudomonadota bacterium]